ncbi:hypothetical protein PSCLAVI8L_130396 [Pseudoclavibacter sp. 8L]|nr:hypothetical protein PSCLAVI8L_130396 [Pseudoclavibacter sp. 8L]
MDSTRGLRGLGEEQRHVREFESLDETPEKVVALALRAERAHHGGDVVDRGIVAREVAIYVSRETVPGADDRIEKLSLADWAVGISGLGIHERTLSRWRSHAGLSVRLRPMLLGVRLGCVVASVPDQAQRAAVRLLGVVELPRHCEVRRSRRRAHCGRLGEGSGHLPYLGALRRRLRRRPQRARVAMGRQGRRPCRGDLPGQGHHHVGRGGHGMIEGNVVDAGLVSGDVSDMPVAAGAPEVTAEQVQRWDEDALAAAQKYARDRIAEIQFPPAGVTKSYVDEANTARDELTSEMREQIDAALLQIIQGYVAADLQLDTALRAYVAQAVASVAWSNLPGRPSTFPPSTHSHQFSELAGGHRERADAVCGVGRHHRVPRPGPVRLRDRIAGSDLSHRRRRGVRRQGAHRRDGHWRDHGSHRDPGQVQLPRLSDEPARQRLHDRNGSRRKRHVEHEHQRGGALQRPPLHHRAGRRTQHRLVRLVQVEDRRTPHLDPISSRSCTHRAGPLAFPRDLIVGPDRGSECGQ